MTRDIIFRYAPAALFGFVLSTAGIWIDNPYFWVLLALFAWNGISYKKSAE